MRTHWSADAVDFLSDIEGMDRFDFIVAKFNKQARKQGWAERSPIAIRVKLRAMGYADVAATLDGFSCRSLAKSLDVYRDRVHGWVEDGYLVAAPSLGGGSPRRIKTSDLIIFATKHPTKLHGIHPDRLKLLIPRAVVYKILTTPHRSTGIKVKVMRMDTGETFGSVSEASRNTHVSRHYLGEMIRNGLPACGIMFKVVGRARADYSHLAERFKP